MASPASKLKEIFTALSPTASTADTPWLSSEATGHRAGKFPPRPSYFTIVFHVNRMSLTVIGVPSDQVTSSRSSTVTENPSPSATTAGGESSSASDGMRV
jgi:hypothetical protein